MSSSSLRLLASSLGTLCLLTAVPTLASVDIQVDAPAKVKGTIAPEGEMETIRFDAVAGSTVSFTIIDKKKSLDLTVDLFGPDDAPVYLAGAAKQKDKDSKIIVKDLPLAMTGSHRLEVTAVGTGKYALELETTALAKWVETFAVATGATESFAFSAPEGSRLIFKAVAPDGSAAEPRFGMFGGQDLSAEGEIESDSHKVSLATTTDGGDLTVEVSNLALVDGAIKVQVKVKAPEQSVQKSDVRGKTVGQPDGDETVVSRNVDATDGGSVAIEDGESDIDGAAVDVPAGALGADTLIAVTSAEDVPLSDPATQQSAGPSVSFGPDGTAFATPASVTIPYSPASLPVGADAATDLKVLRVTSTGIQTILDPIAVDLVEETVTVETTGFSRFGAFTDRGSPALDGRSYWFFLMEVEHEPNLPSGPSWGRLVAQASGTALFGDTGAGTFSFTGSEKDTDLDHDPAGIGSTDVTNEAFEGGGESGTWSYLGGGQSVALSTGPGDDDDFYFVSEAGRFLLGMAETSPDDGFNAIELLIEKPSELPTVASLAGTFYWADLFFEAEANGGGPLAMGAGGTFGTITLASNGTFSLNGTEKGSEFSGSLETFSETDPSDGTFRVEPDGSVVLDFGGEETDTFYPGADGDVLVGADGEDTMSAGGNFGILTRQGSDLTASILNGEYATVGLEIELETATIAASTVADFESFNVESRVGFDGIGMASYTGTTERAIFRDDLAPGGVQIDTDAEPAQSVPYTLNSKGKLDLSSFDGENDVRGGALPDGGLLFWGPNGAPASTPAGVFLSIKLPPLQP